MNLKSLLHETEIKKAYEKIVYLTSDIKEHINLFKKMELFPDVDTIPSDNQFDEFMLNMEILMNELNMKIFKLKLTKKTYLNLKNDLNDDDIL